MRPPATGKQEERQTGRQYRRQDLGKADTPSNTKADTLRKPTPTVHCLKKCKIRPPTTKGNKKKDKLGDKLGDKKEDKLGDKGDKGDKTSGRWTHHPTQGNKKGDKGETRPRESGRTMQHRSHISRETMGGNENQDFGKVDHPTQAHVGRQWETIGGNGRQWDNGKHVETTGDKDRQEGRQGETRLREGGHTIQHRHTCGDNGRQFGNKTSGRRTHHPTQVHTCGETMGENGEQWGTRGDKTLKRRAHHSSKGTMEDDKGRQDLAKADTPSNTNAYCGETIGDKRRQDLGKADSPSNTGTCGETVGDNGRQGRGQRRQTYHHRHTCGETMGDKKGRQHVGKADPPSNTGKCVGRQCETMRSMGQKG